MVTKPWREIFDPAAQIFLNLNVRHYGGMTGGNKRNLKDYETKTFRS
jgi:hypothetical protein